MDPLWADFYTSLLFDGDALERAAESPLWNVRAEVASGADVAEAIRRTYERWANKGCD